MILPQIETWQKWGQLLVLLIVTSSLSTVIAPPPAALAQDNQQPQPLEGVFTVTIDAVDVPAGLSDGPALAGVWSIDLGGDGDFSLYRLDVGQVASGRFETGDTTITFNEWNGIIGCIIGDGGDDEATYGWRRSESSLILTPIRESCPVRMTLLATRPLGSEEACVAPAQSVIDPSIVAAGDRGVVGTPSAGVPQASGVAAQEGLSEVAKAEAAIDGLLGQANGCWATGDAQSFLALHSDNVIQQLVFMAPPDLLVSRLRQLMRAPASFDRIGDVILADPDHAWTYVELTYDADPLPQRVDFVNQDGTWLFDTYLPLTLSQPVTDVNVQP